MPAKKNRRAAQDVARAFNRRKLPAFFTPMIAQRADRLPEGNEWTYELKLDGYRALLFKDGARVWLRSRNDKDLTIMYPSIVADGGRLNANQAVVDGEIVAVDHLGRPSFQALQHRGSHPKHTVVFYAFDLPYVDGIDLMNAPLEERRAKLLEITKGSRVLFSQTLPGAAADVVRAIRAAGLEGVIAKRKSSLYVPDDRTNDWVS
jgi:bifunctional non-homologous end joining protein LigD